MPVAFYNIILCGHIIFGMEAPPLGFAAPALHTARASSVPTPNLLLLSQRVSIRVANANPDLAPDFLRA